MAGTVGMIGLLGFSTQTMAACVTLPSCYELGYTKSVSECEGHDYLKCPFDQSRGYCDLSTETTPVVQTCESMGYTKTAAQCAGYQLIACPSDNSKYKCGEAKYNIGDPWSVNGAIIGSIIEVNGNILTIASAPVHFNDKAPVSEAELNQHCAEISYGGALWYPMNEEQSVTAYRIFKTVLGEAKLVANSGDSNSYSRIQYCNTDCSTNSYSLHYISCRAAFNAE